jgi:hypothetical protein
MPTFGVGSEEGETVIGLVGAATATLTVKGRSLASVRTKLSLVAPSPLFV